MGSRTELAMADPRPTLQIRQLKVRDLIENPRNARTHPRKQIRQIAKSIERFGFNNPILIDETGMILAGHGRARAAAELGMELVPCVRLDHMSEAEKRAYVLADNKLALNSGWDEALLAEELGVLASLDTGFELDVTGFSIAEIDTLLDADPVEEPGDPRDDAQPVDAPKRVRPGDIWQLGRHRLICADARDPDAISRLMAGEKARMAFTDPPYNVAIAGNVSGKGGVQHRDFAMASGEMDAAAFTQFLSSTLKAHADHSCDGAIHFVCMDWRHVRELEDAGQGVYSELKNMIVWVKDNAGMGTFYRSRHELVFAFKVGTAPHVNSFELGQHGRWRTNVWEYRGVNSRKGARMDELALHPTVKPVELVADAIRDVSGRGEIIIDLFAGSGSTLIAAEKTGRRAHVCEIDPVYCDRILARWEAYARDDAELVDRAAKELEAVR